MTKQTIEALEHKLEIAEDSANIKDDPESAESWVPTRDQLKAALAAGTLVGFPLAAEELDNYLGFDCCYCADSETLNAEGKAIFDDLARAGFREEHNPNTVTYSGGRRIKPRTRLVDGKRYDL